MSPATLRVSACALLIACLGPACGCSHDGGSSANAVSDPNAASTHDGDGSHGHGATSPATATATEARPGAHAVPPAPEVGGDSGLQSVETSIGATLAVPSRWRVEQPSNSMRIAQVVVPGPDLTQDGAADDDSGAADAEAILVVSYFGRTGGGPVQANLDRWRSQFEQSEADREHDRVDTRQVPAGKAHVMHLLGRFVAPVMPGTTGNHDESGWRMFAAILETSQGNLFFKCTGPAATLDAAQPDFDRMLESLRVP